MSHKVLSPTFGLSCKNENLSVKEAQINAKLERANLQGFSPKNGLHKNVPTDAEAVADY